MTVLGVPVKFTNTHKDKIQFHKATTGLDSDKNLKPKLTFDIRDLIIPFNIDYNRRVETYMYITYSDMIAKIGGIKSAISPIFNLMIPFLAICFLIQLSKIIKVKSKNYYKEELIAFIKTYINKVDVSKKVKLIEKFDQSNSTMTLEIVYQEVIDNILFPNHVNSREQSMNLTGVLH